MSRIAFDPTKVLSHDVIPGGAYWTRRIRRGTTLRLLDPHGSHGVAFLCYNADDPVERYNAADTVKIQNMVYLTAGHVLYSDMGRVLFSITADTSGHHDTFGGASTPASTRAQYGAGSYQERRNEYFRDARSNFTMALGRHGLGARDLMPNINFFSNVRVEPDGRLQWVADTEHPGVSIDLRAEMNVLAVVSNTPHPLRPGSEYAPTPLRALVWDSPPPAVDDVNRTRSEEARRGFQNTDEVFL